MPISRPLLVLESLSLSCALVLTLTGCPQTITTEQERAAAAKEAKKIAANDDRVVADSGDLYAVRPNRPASPSRSRHDSEEKAPGSGTPDETNGVCRLFAPEHPNPLCCDVDFGFDVETVQRVCGERMYMGESFHATCGYHFFKPPAGDMTYYRLSYALGDSVEFAAGEHDERMRVQQGAPASFKSTPVPGAPGALWSSHEGINWAFLPGWSRVRQLSWRDSGCPNEKVAEIIKQLAEAPEVPSGLTRAGMIPKMRTAEELALAQQQAARAANMPTPVDGPDPR